MGVPTLLANRTSWTHNQVMKDISVSELKAHLSRYLRAASRGARIVVKDREEPIAQLGPLQGPASSWRQRLAGEGRLIMGTQKWEKLTISKLGRKTDIAASLDAIREDPSEVRRR
jgi:antitoxin (DNA-binding transcriptional repressor) of toxin-antitoxin stability system